MKKILLSLCALFLAVVLCLFFLARGGEAGTITYGVTFSAQYAKEIKIDWKAAYAAMLDDLKIRHIRIPAYWTDIEPLGGVFAWDELDYQIREAEKRGAKVVIAVGRRVPRWPECHEPTWAEQLSWDEKKKHIQEVISAVITRYKNNPTVEMWQIENEPFLTAFATEHCGNLDEQFLHEEIALAHSLDSRKVMVTDGGNFGTWAGAYRAGDVFGTSMYLYFWREDIGAFRTILPPAYYRAKVTLMHLLFGEKPVILSELSLEPWLAAHIEDVPLEEQISRMSLEKMREIVDYGRASGLDTHYLWGVEWWFYMKEKGHPEFWDFAKHLYTQEND